MHDVHKPTRWVSIYARMASWLFWSLTAAWVLLLTMWLVLHWIIVPRIDEFRPWLQEQASQALGLRVEMGPMSGRTRGLVTELQLDQIRLLDAQQQARLDLGQVTLALTPTSVLSGAFSQIALEQLDLDIRRDTQGRLWLAGIPLQSDSRDNRLRNWVFSQWEWVLRNSRLRWSDESRPDQALQLEHIEGVLRNGLRDHHFRIDGNPNPEMGDRFSWRGRLRQPLLSTQAGLWEDWSGTSYVETRRVELDAWAQRLPGLSELKGVQGQGWLRVWMDIRAGRMAQWSTDFGLSDVRVQIDRKERAALSLGLQSARGRLGWMGGNEDKWTLQQALLSAPGATPWAIGQASLTLRHDSQQQIEGGLVQIDEVSLASLTPWVDLAPESWSSLWTQAAPQGYLRQVQGRFQGPWAGLQLQNWRAQVSEVSWQAGPVSKAAPLARWPGVSGLSAELEGGASAMHGSVKVESGELYWPGLWDEPKHKIGLFKAEVNAEQGSEGHRLELKSAQLLTDQARADFRLSWVNTPSDPHGRIDLQGDVPFAPVTQVLRWLPTSLPDPVRQYLKQALPQGELRQAHARVLGRVDDFPFKRPDSGEFYIRSQVSKVRYLTLPRGFSTDASEGEWPVLQDLSAEWVLDRNAMRLSKVKARLAQAPGIQWPILEAQIKNMDQAIVEVRAEGKGPLAEALAVWKSMPLNGMTDRVLDSAKAQGQAEYRMNLSIPVQDAEQTQAKGQVVLQGNDILMAPGTPGLGRARGTLAFTADGFELQGLQATLWGGEVRLDGGAKASAETGAPKAQIRAQGQLSAAGLRDAPELAPWSAHLKKMQGSTQYVARLQWRRGQLESEVNSDLVGMAIQAPTGLGKSAAEPLPIRWESKLSAESAASSGLLQEQMALRWGLGLEARFIRDLSGQQAKVLRGLIRWGAAAAAQMPAQGVTLRVNAERFNLDEWADWLQPFGSTPVPGGGAWDFAPQRIDFQARQFQAQGRPLNQVQLNALRVGEVWRGQVSAQELEGDWQYQASKSPEPAKLQARLARLTVPASQGDADAMPDSSVQDLPTLDIQVKDFDWRGKRLGSLELIAVNRQRPDAGSEWRLNKFQIVNDDADFMADGVWRKSSGAQTSQTQFDFKMNVKNMGTLLQRVGVPDAVRNGHGSIEGLVNWNGSPITPDLGSIGGQFKIGIERGQFLKTEPGAARLLGVLSLQSLPRRLMLDFRDVFSEGFAFDFFRGDVKIERGIASSNNLQMKGVNVAVLMEGQAHIANETQDLKVLVIPDINAGAASLMYSAINPLIGLTTFVAQYVLRRPLSESSTQQFHIDGTWSEPRVTQVPFKSDAKP